MKKEIFELNPGDYFIKNEHVYVQCVRVTVEQLKKNVSRFDGKFHRDRYISFLYVVSGRATQVIGDETLEIQKGDLLFLNHDIPHATFFNKTEKTPLLYYEIIFVPQFLGIDNAENASYSALCDTWLLDDIASLRSFENPPFLLLHPKSDMLSLFKKMYNEYILRKSGFLGIIRSTLIELITKFHRELQPNSQVNYFQQKSVDKCIVFLESNYTDPDLDIDSYLSGLYVSKSYFKQVFKKTTGQSISAYLLHLRLNKVCQLLVDYDFSITETAIRCGFSDMKSFYRSFKSTIGMLPSEFRKKEGEC